MCWKNWNEQQRTNQMLNAQREFGASNRSIIWREEFAKCDVVSYFSREEKLLVILIHWEAHKNKNILRFLSFLHVWLMVHHLGALLFFCLNMEHTSHSLHSKTAWRAICSLMHKILTYFKIKKKRKINWQPNSFSVVIMPCCNIHYVNVIFFW